MTISEITLDRPAARAAYDGFARAGLPPREAWPELDLSHPAYRYPARLNCVTEFLDRWIEAGAGERLAFLTPSERWKWWCRSRSYCRCVCGQRRIRWCWR
jgi:hypothetical protein